MPLEKGPRRIAIDSARLPKAPRILTDPCQPSGHGNRTAQRRIGLAPIREDSKGNAVVVPAPALKLLNVQELRPRPRRKRRGTARHRGQRDTQHEKRQRCTGATDHAPASVATSSQLGSRLPSWREKVQMSLTSDTASALPSTTVPFASRVTLMSCDTKETVT